MAAYARREIGQLVIEDVPEFSDSLIERSAQYQNTRSAGVHGWIGDGILISTRFAETSQLHHVGGPGAYRRQLTFFTEPIASAAPAPVSSPLTGGFVYTKDKGGAEFYQIYAFDPLSGLSVLVTDGKQSKNGGVRWNRSGSAFAYFSTERNGTDFDIAVATVSPRVDGGPLLFTRRTLFASSGEGAGTGVWWRPLDFSPCGRRLLVNAYRSASDSSIHVLDVDSGRIIATVDGTPPHAASPDGAQTVSCDGALWTLDGNHVIFVSDRGADFRGLYVWQWDGVNGGAVVHAVADSTWLNWDVEDFDISCDGRHAVFTVNEDGISTVYNVAISGGTSADAPLVVSAAAKLDAELPVGCIHSVCFHPIWPASFAVTVDAADSPGDVYVANIGPAGPHSNTVFRWTFSEVGGLPRENFVVPKLIRYASFDGLSVPAFFYKPKGDRGKVPVVIHIHGGPESQARPGFRFNFQFLAVEMGVAVLDVNVRGSSGYGKRYLTLDFQGRRMDSARDIGALLDWIAAQPDLDAQRVGVLGGSYGGYMVLQALVQYGDRICAGAEMVGIANFVTFLENTQGYRKDLRRRVYGDERNPDMRKFLVDISPVTHASTIRSPLLVGQGLNGWSPATGTSHGAGGLLHPQAHDHLYYVLIGVIVVHL
eukprot:Opistho-2@53567